MAASFEPGTVHQEPSKSRIARSRSESPIRLSLPSWPPGIKHSPQHRKVEPYRRDKDPAHFETLRRVKGAVASEPGGDSAQSAPPHDFFLDFEEWYRSEYDRLVSVLEKLGARPAYSEELAAEAFARALERWDRVSEMASPTGWVYTVAFNLLRRRARRAASELLALRRMLPVTSSDARTGIWEEVRRLPNRQRQAVALHYVLDLPYEVVAALMGITEGTVAATLASARRQLGARLSQDPEEESDD